MKGKSTKKTYKKKSTKSTKKVGGCGCGCGGY